jgi:transposase-like protein
LEGRDPATVFESGGLVDELKKRLAERMLNGEMDHHLGTAAELQTGNHRNGYSSKTVLSDTGKLELSIPRDRQGRFDPMLIGKYRRRFAGFDDKIIALYARGMSTREIAEHIGELYGTEISPDLVSAVTDAVLEEVALWAEPRAGGDLRHRLLRRAAGENSQRGSGQQPLGVPGHRRDVRVTRKSSGFGSSRPRGRSSGCG